MRRQTSGAMRASVGAVLSLLLLHSAPALAQASASPYTTGYRYDLQQRLVGKISPDPDGAGAIHYAAERRTYNSLGMLASVEVGELANWHDENTLPANWTDFNLYMKTAYAYDYLGRKTTEQVIGKDGVPLTQKNFSYDEIGRPECTATRMNPAAFASLTVDACTLGPEGQQGKDRITVRTYDVESHVLTERRAVGTPDEYTYSTSTYQTNGLLQSTADANGNLSWYAYDGLQRLKTFYLPSKTTAGQYDAADYEQYSYDVDGNRTQLRKRDGHVITYDFDPLNREVDEVFPAGTLQNVYYGYDLTGLQTYARFTSSTGKGLTNTYDGFGRLATSKTDQGTAARTLSYQYDREGNRLRITHPDGNYFVYGYDGLNRLIQIFENASTTPVISIAYDANGHRASMTRGASVSSTTYGYDAIGRLNSLTQDLSGTTADETRGFAFNPASQVVSRTLNSDTYLFKQAPTVLTNYQVNGLNQYTQLSTSSSVAPTYDANGNMTSDGASTFAYDVLNRMTGSTGSKAVSLAYDPKGRLFQTSGGASGTTQFLYDGDALVAEYDGAGTLKSRYVHGSGVDEPLVQYVGANVGMTNRQYLHADHQGSVVAIADANGGAVQTNTYDPYGVWGTSNSGRFQYTGQILLPDLGQYFYKARIYNPALGRFMQTDPVGYADDFDLYAYVANDPMNRVDPSGKSAALVADAVLATVVIVGFEVCESCKHWVIHQTQVLNDWMFSGSGNNTNSTPTPKNASSPQAGNASSTPPSNGPDGDGDDKPKRITNPKHHQNSESPEPKNVDDLYNNSTEDKNGVRWSKDADGTVHRFSKPSNGESHWNGSTGGSDPIKMDNIPAFIKRLFGIRG